MPIPMHALPSRIEPPRRPHARTNRNQHDTRCSQDRSGADASNRSTSHLTFARKPFRAQVPSWLPLDPDTVVLQSGVVELSLGAALLFSTHRKALVGRVAAGFFTAIFSGNIDQYRLHRNAFGLDTDNKRLARLFFQPLLVAWALWSTNALK